MTDNSSQHDPVKSDHSDHSDQSDHRRIWSIAWPSIIAGSSVPLVQLVDTWALGHLSEAVYLAAVAFAGTVFTFIFWAFGFLRMGTTGLVAQTIGAHSDDTLNNSAPDRSKAPDSIQNSSIQNSSIQNSILAFNVSRVLAAVMVRALTLAAGIGCALILFQSLFLTVAAEFMQPPSAVFKEATGYYEIRIWSAIAVLITYGVTGYLIGSAQAKLSLLLTLLVNGLNAALNILFVVGLQMGVAGVALGTLIAETVAAAVGLYILGRQIGLPPLIQAFTTATTWRLSKMVYLFKINGALFVRTVLLITALALITREAAVYGAVTMAAAQVLMTYMLLISLGLDGFAFAAEALVGAAYGKGDKQQFNAVVRQSFIWASGAALLYALVFGLFAPSITALLTDIQPVRMAVDQAIIPLALLPLAAVAAYQFDGVYIGATASSAMMGTMIAAFIPYVILLPLWAAAHGIAGIWWALCLLMTLRGLGQLLWYPVIVRRIGLNSAEITE